MKKYKLTIRNGKVILEEKEKPKDPLVIEQIQNITIAIQEKAKEEKQLIKYCKHCDQKKEEWDQKYCESCGYEL